MALNVFAREYWYNYVDINILLTDLSKRQYIVCDSASADIVHQQHIIHGACKQLMEHCGSIKSAVVPINFGFSDNGVYEGSHWAGLVIKISSNNKFEALYADSLGTIKNPSLKTVLENNGIYEILDCSVKQQHNSYDCGPCVVFNLDSLARTGRLPNNITEEAILKQRSTLRKLIKDQPGVMKFVNLPDSSIGSKPPEITKTLNEENKNEEIKVKDIEILTEMIKTITSFENCQLDMRNTVIEIGNMSGQISYNDMADPNSYYIRNRYGYIQRNKNKLQNKNGIYFEKLYQLKISFSDDGIYSSCTEDDKERLGLALYSLKRKVGNILEIETKSENSIMEEDFSLLDLNEISTKYYEQMVLQKINDEFKHLENIDFLVRENRYFFARIFTIVGELMNEFLEDKLSKKGDHCKVWNIFKDLMNIRNLVIHYPLKIKSFTESSSKAKEINKNLIEIKSHLNKIIFRHTPIGQFQIDNEYHHCDAFADEIKSMLNYLSSKLESPNRDRDLINQSIKASLDKLILKATKLFERLTSNKKQENEIDVFLKINNQYQIQLNKLDTNERNSYPESLNLKNKDIIIGYNTLNKSRKTPKKLKLNDEELKEEKIFDRNFKKPIDKNELKFSIDRLIMKAFGIISSKKINETEIYKQLGHLDNQYQSELKKLDDYERSSYPNRLDIVNRNLIVKYCEPFIKDKLVKQINEINEEMEYFQFVESNTEIGKIKKQYIIEHIMAVIGQYFRDLLNLGLTNFKDVQLPDDKWFVNKFIASEILTEASGSVRRCRNEGLAHNIWSADNVKLGKVIIDDMVPAFRYLEKLTGIHEEESIPMSTYALYSLGIAFTDIGLHQKAIDYLQRALKYFDDLSNESEIWTKSDTFKMISGIDYAKFQIYFNLGHVYRLSYRYQEALKIMELLISQINFDSVVACDDKGVKEEIAHLYKEISYFSISQSDYKKTIELCERVSMISINYETQFHLVVAYWRDGQNEKAIDVLEDIKNLDKNCLLQFLYFETIAMMCIENSRNNECHKILQKCVVEMENLMNDKIAVFKKRSPHAYVLEKLRIIYFKITLTMSEICINKSYDISILKDLEKSFLELFQGMNYDLKKDRLISHVYINFCKCYCCYFLCNQRTFNIVLEMQKYFDLAEVSNQNMAEPLPDIEENLVVAAMGLTLSYNICIEIIDTKLLIQYLEKTLDIQEKYGLSKYATAYNLAQSHFELGIIDYWKFMENKNPQHSESALSHFDNAVKYCKLNALEPKDEKAAKFMISNYRAKGISISYDNPVDELHKNTVKLLAMSYNRIGVLRYDVWLMKKAVRYYDKLLKLRSIAEDHKIYENEKSKCQQKISSINSLLNFCLASRGDLLLSDYALDFVVAKFNLQEKMDLDLFGKDKHLLKEIQPSIQRELLIFSDEAILLYKFGKVLVKMGFIKQYF